MSFAVLSPAFRGLQFPFRDMFVLTVDRNSFTGNNGRPSCGNYSDTPSGTTPIPRQENYSRKIIPPTDGTPWNNFPRSGVLFIVVCSYMIQVYLLTSRCG